MPVMHPTLKLELWPLWVSVQRVQVTQCSDLMRGLISNHGDSLNELHQTKWYWITASGPSVPAPSCSHKGALRFWLEHLRYSLNQKQDFTRLAHCETTRLTTRLNPAQDLPPHSVYFLFRIARMGSQSGRSGFWSSYCLGCSVSLFHGRYALVNNNNQFIAQFHNSIH